MARVEKDYMARVEIIGDNMERAWVQLRVVDSRKAISRPRCRRKDLSLMPIGRAKGGRMQIIVGHLKRRLLQAKSKLPTTDRGIEYSQGFKGPQVTMATDSFSSIFASHLS